MRIHLLRVDKITEVKAVKARAMLEILAGLPGVEKGP